MSKTIFKTIQYPIQTLIDDIDHYSKIVIVLKDTDRLMKEIDKIKFE